MMHATSPPISTPCADLLRRALLASALAWVSHVSGAAAQTQAHPAPPASAAPADDGQWTMPAKNYAATRYSELDRDHTGKRRSLLGVAFTFSTGTIKGQEAAPIVVDNTMFMVTPYPNYVYALDLTKPGAPMKWMYRAAAGRRIAGRRVLRRRQSRCASIRTASCSSTRSTATPSRSTRRPASRYGRRKLGDINKGETITMAPLRGEGQGAGRRFRAARSACAAG